MALSDPIADFLTRIRNASRAQRRFVDVNWSKINQSMADILKGQGFIDSCLVKKDENGRGMMRIFLKYSEHRQPVIQGLQRVSKPGTRKYVGYEEIPNFYGSLGLTIVSTSQGLLPGMEARQRKIGGELLCKVW